MREKLQSRFGFLMLAAGCAVGLGNVWRFPFVAGQNGGAAFVLVYLAFLVLLGFPLLVVELAIGRRAACGIARAMPKLAGGRHVALWRTLACLVFAGNFVLMAYYTDVAGWLVKFARDYAVCGTPVPFSHLLADKPVRTLYMLLTVALATAVCCAGVVKGVERVTKVLMVSLLALLCVLAAKALSLPGAGAGVRFYLLPDWGAFLARPGRVVMAAMGQAFFTLSLGVGCMTIFGSYITREHSLVKEAALIIAIDTFVALLAGLVVFPACHACGVEPSSGPGLVFSALPEVFSRMAGGRVWGLGFFLFLAFAALTTVIAVFECLIGGLCDEKRARDGQDIARSFRPFVALLVGVAVALASLPCVLWEKALEIEDFAVSQLWLPLGALVQCLFATWAFGWGWRRFRGEASRGDGANMPAAAKYWMRFFLPLLILAVLVGGLVAS